MFMLGDSSKQTYKNSEQAARAYYSGCLQYHIESIEKRLENFFRVPKTQHVEFDLDALIRTEMDVRFSSYATAINSGFKTINEVRKKEGDPKVDGGDEPLVQIQYRPLSQAILPPPAGVPVEQPAPPADDPPEDEGDDNPDQGDEGDDEKAAVHYLRERLAA
jgi:hypothetical protein